nr:vacuolar protein sorting-associated protein 41 like [Quercus suber]
MSADRPTTDQNNEQPPATSSSHDHADEEEEDDEDEEEEEPKLKYDKVTAHLSNVYRNGDSTSTFTVIGDKLVVGTHNGSVHVLELPTLQPLRTYHTTRHATVTSISISPTPLPLAHVRSENRREATPSLAHGKTISHSQGTAKARATRTHPPQSIPATPNNQIYIATSLLDGYVCISSLTDVKDVQLRNFGRPVQAVALSPDYKNDRTYLSGGLAGNLILTVGGKIGASTDANTNSAAAAASGWLGSIGLGAQNGKDTILHSGEGSIGTIKWSLSGKWVVWVNEEGIKLMRSNIKLGSEDSENAWKRVAHAARPNNKIWREMAGVWKARAEWVDDRKLESDELVYGTNTPVVNGNGSVSVEKKAKKFEKLVVGWGDKAWVLHVHEGGNAPGRRAGEKQVGSVDMEHTLQFTDCILSGISLYTPSTLAVLAYRTKDDNDRPIHTTDSDANPTTSRKSKHRRTGLAPELRLININDGAEMDVDELSNLSRFEALSAQDYHLGMLYVPPPISEESVAEQRGALEAVWQVSGGRYAQRMFSSSASVLSRSSSDRDETGRVGTVASPRSSIHGVTYMPARRQLEANRFLVESGLKLFIQSPYDCVLATKRDLSDHLDWRLKHADYAGAWQLLDEHPAAVDSSEEDHQSLSSLPESPSRPRQSLADFFGDDISGTGDSGGARSPHSAAQKEKRRISDLWLQQLVDDEQWEEAGIVAGKVLGTSSRWAHWVWTFAQAQKFDEITPYIPSTQLSPHLPSMVYDVLLGHYVAEDRVRMSKLLETWDPELFDVSSVIAAIENQLDGHEVAEDTVEDGIEGRDWRLLVEALAKLYLASGRAQDALRCYVRSQNADAAMDLIRGENLLNSIADDIPSLLTLRITREQMNSNLPLSDMEAGSSEVVRLLIEEAHRGTVMPEVVIKQLKRKGPTYRPFLFFYLRSLWHGPSEQDSRLPRRKFHREIFEGHALVEDHGDLAIELFAEYDRDLLMTFLQTANTYDYEKAAQICEHRDYIPELIHICSQTGQTDRALTLIIERLGDVSQAIAFAKENSDLWDDLLDYSMNKPSFIRGLLEEVGTAVDPVQLLRRIPEGLEIPGLRAGIQRMIREYEIQHSISEGVAKVLSGEVGMGMDTLRAGRKKAVHFDVVHETSDDVDLAVRDIPTTLPPDGEFSPSVRRSLDPSQPIKPGHCVGCGEAFHEHELEPLIGFACGHVYHLTCLLRANPETESDDTIDELLGQLGYDRGKRPNTDLEEVGVRSVGAKNLRVHPGWNDCLDEVYISTHTSFDVNQNVVSSSARNRESSLAFLTHLILAVVYAAHTGLFPGCHGVAYLYLLQLAGTRHESILRHRLAKQLEFLETVHVQNYPESPQVGSFPLYTIRIMPQGERTPAAHGDAT